MNWEVEKTNLLLNLETLFLNLNVPKDIYFIIKNYIGSFPEEILLTILLTFPLPQEEWEVLRDPFCQKLKVHSLYCADLSLHWICDYRKSFILQKSSGEKTLQQLKKILYDDQEIPGIEVHFFLPDQKKAKEYGPKRGAIILKSKTKKSSFEIIIDEYWNSKICFQDVYKQ